MQKKWNAIGIAFVLVMATSPTASANGLLPEVRSEQLLGGALYFDTNLSANRNQACASCHLPATGFDDPDSNLPVSQGSFLTEFGGRNAPSAAYAAFAPKFSLNGDGLYEGGQFWDGRADNLAKQAEGPPTNPVEMALDDHADVVGRLAENPAYVLAFKAIYGINIMKRSNVEIAYTKMAKAIGEFERTRQFNKFNSKFDNFAFEQGGDVSQFGVDGNGDDYTGPPTGFRSRYFSLQEAKGLALFNAADKGNCAACHLSGPTTATDGQVTPPLFTDFTYDNLGIPVNPEIARLKGEVMPRDLGLGGRLDALPEYGKFKVMSLRNIAKTAPYGHNGYFKTLKEIVHFYNTRDVPGAGWPAAEVPETMNMSELGDLGLTSAEEDAIVAFMKTLTDGIGPSPYGDVPVPAMP